MSQPFDRSAKVPQPGKLDKSLGEFWVENPWEITIRGHNLSAYERNRIYLNVPSATHRTFLEISHLTGADSDGDGRCTIPADLRNTGQMDLIVRQVGGGPLLIYENRFPLRHYLKVSLQGTKSNKQGIGARLIATVRGQSLVREMYPLTSFRSQTPCIVHFGLGEATSVEKLVIRWPSGIEQVLTGLAADQHILVEEGKDGPAAIQPIVPKLVRDR